MKKGDGRKANAVSLSYLIRNKNNGTERNTELWVVESEETSTVIFVFFLFLIQPSRIHHLYSSNAIHHTPSASDHCPFHSSHPFPARRTSINACEILFGSRILRWSIWCIAKAHGVHQCCHRFQQLWMERKWMLVADIRSAVKAHGDTHLRASGKSIFKQYHKANSWIHRILPEFPLVLSRPVFGSLLHLSPDVHPNPHI